MMPRASLTLAAIAAVCASAGWGQVIQFESGGLKYQTLSKNGVTVMFAPMAAHLREYQILQTGISNGSQDMVLVRPEDFIFERADGTRLYATPAKTVVEEVLDHASRNDVIRLISTYENTLNGVARFRSTNGFEARRQNFLADAGAAKLRAAAAASAIAMVETRLKPGESTDGAVFFYTSGKPLGPGRVLVRTKGGLVYDFDPDPTGPTKTLVDRGAATTP